MTEVTFKLTPSEDLSWVGGQAYRFYFPNGYGASVVRHDWSYGANEGLWELAVLDDSHKLTYNTPITNDVIGWLDLSEVNTHLDRIAELEKGAY